MNKLERARFWSVEQSHGAKGAGRNQKKKEKEGGEIAVTMATE